MITIEINGFGHEAAAEVKTPEKISTLLAGLGENIKIKVGRGIVTGKSSQHQRYIVVSALDARVRDQIAQQLQNEFKVDVICTLIDRVFPARQ